MTIDWQAIGAEMQRVAPDGLTIDYLPVDSIPATASENATWFIGDGDVEAFGATLEAAWAEFVRQRGEAVQP